MTQDVNHNDMQQLVTEIAKALVDDPQAVEVQAVARDENTVLRLRVASADVGKVIGKQGRTARSMRTILSAVSMKLHHRYTLDILEEDEAGKPRISLPTSRNTSRNAKGSFFARQPGARPACAKQRWKRNGSTRGAWC